MIGQLAALGTALCWTVTSLSFEAAGKRIGSLQVNIIRLAIAIAFFAVVGLFTRGQPIPLDAGAHVWVWLSLSGLIGFVLGDLFLFQAFVDVGARTAMLVYSSVPPMTAVIGWLVLGERLSPVQWLAIGLTVAGIMTVTTARAPLPAPAGGSTDTGAYAPAHRLRGIWFAALGALGQALGLVLGRYGAPVYDAFGATQIRAIAGFAGFAVLFVVRRRWRHIFVALHDRTAMRHTVRGAFFGPFLGVSLGLYAAQRAGTGVASTIMAIVPVLLIPVAIIAFRERVTLREVVGAVLAVGGVAILFLA